MLLAADIGGTKSSIGLFARGAARPRPIETRTYRTLEFGGLSELTRRFLRDAGHDGPLEAAAFGVAGPITGDTVQMTNVPWVVALEELARVIPVGRAYLLNDLEALAWSLDVLSEDELDVLHAGEPDPAGSAALIAAGTGLGTALLPRIDGRLRPMPSEGGHVDFAPRTAQERLLTERLAKTSLRVELEQVVSGPGLVNIHRLMHPHQCDAHREVVSERDVPAAISHGALRGKCPDCTRTLKLFLSAYGSAAGNLALTTLSTGGVYLGGGIAPRIRPALRWPEFLEAFLDKPPLDDLLRRVPVRVILNHDAGMIGAATYASARAAGL